MLYGAHAVIPHNTNKRVNIYIVFVWLDRLKSVVAVSSTQCHSGLVTALTLLSFINGEVNLNNIPDYHS